MAKLRQIPEQSGQELGQGPNLPRRNSDERLDSEGIPISEAVSGWLNLFDSTGSVDPRASRWLQGVLRFTRADGSPVFGPRGRSPARLRAIQAWSDRLGDPSLSAVVARWLPSRSFSNVPSPPPLPNFSDVARPLAVFRTDWGSGSDLAAIDHRQFGDETSLEVAARGRIWLGPSWTSGETSGRCSKSLPAHRSSSPFADVVEWSYKVGTRKVTRTMVLLRGRSMALLGQQDEGGSGPSETRFELGEGIEARPVEGSRALQLSAGRGQPTARLLPLGLPAHDRPTESGSISIEGGQVVIRQHGEGRRRWLPALLCWGKTPTSWRPLTVAERSKSLKGDTAFAVRVAWGIRDDDLVIYRSLGPPALRSRPPRGSWLDRSAGRAKSGRSSSWIPEPASHLGSRGGRHDRHQRGDDVDQDDGHRQIARMLVGLDQLDEIRRVARVDDQEAESELRDDQQPGQQAKNQQDGLELTVHRVDNP